MRTLFDVVSAMEVVALMRESIRVTLVAAFERELRTKHNLHWIENALEITPELIDRLARELANNTTQVVLSMEVVDLGGES